MEMRQAGPKFACVASRRALGTQLENDNTMSETDKTSTPVA